ncbi:MAG TPA: phosphatase PAP2 family protein [Sphingomicrobium sp.]|nr:phosphatase PAP2 family protein [Sphingomicrobium sp.]
MSSASTIRKAAKHLVEWDEKATEAAAELRDTPISGAIAPVGKLGDQPELRALSAVVLVAGLLASKPRLLRAGLRMLVAHESATLAKDAVKNQVDRTRPRSAERRGEGAPRPGNSSAKEESSFPSGHSAGAIAVASAFAREFPEHRSAAMGAALVIAAAQVPRASHYPTDILAGLALGLGVESLINAGWLLAEGDDVQASSITAAAPASAEETATIP